MLIEIAETRPAAPGKKVATVVAAGGQRFHIWPENLAHLRVGGKYEVEVTDREYNGRIYRKITKAVTTATQAETPPSTSTAPQPGCLCSG